MPKSDLRMQPGGEYAPVAERIRLFYQACPTGRIITRLISHSEGRMIVQAFVFRSASDRHPSATGLAAEREADGEINAVACLENTETSAIGRALANLGFTASRERPSAEEMARAEAARARLARRVSVVAEPPAPRRSIEDDPLQRRANALHDLLALVNRAEAMGYPAWRARVLRDIPSRLEVPPSRVARVERRIRAWIARRRADGR